MLYADEGDVVKAGKVVAVMDTRELEAQIKQYQELVLQYEHTLEQAKSTYAAQQAVVKFAQEQVSRSQTLVSRGFVTKETLDQRMQLLNSAIANLKGDQDAIQAAQHALDAAKHQVEYFSVQVADNQLTAPKMGRSNIASPMSARSFLQAARCSRMLDASYVYMDISLFRRRTRVGLESDRRHALCSTPIRAMPSRLTSCSSRARRSSHRKRWRRGRSGTS